MTGVDVTVVTKDEPNQPIFQSFVKSHPEFYLDREPHGAPLIRSRGVGTRFGRKASRDSEPTLVYGPLRVFEPEDMEPEIAALIPAPCWQVDIDCAVASEETWRDAFALAEHVAKACKGVVWNGELGITWPQNTRGAPRESRTLDLLKLEWVVHRSKEPVKSGQRLLQTLREFMPEARPTRFGAYNPLQGRLGADSDQPFLDFWKDCYDQGFGRLAFRSKHPLVEGFVTFPRTSPLEARDRSWAPRVRPTEEIVTITMEFDAGTVSSDKSTCERVVTLFKQVAKRLQSFYARGYVERRFSWYRSEPVDVPQVTELYPAALGYEWMGIPAEPAWLSWFGRPYTPFLAQPLKALGPEVSDDGIFVRLGSKPADLRQLRNSGTKLPKDLLVKRAEHDSGDEEMSKLSKAGMWSPPSFTPRRADLIPEIDR